MPTIRRPSTPKKRGTWSANRSLGRTLGLPEPLAGLCTGVRLVERFHSKEKILLACERACSPSPSMTLGNMRANGVVWARAAISDKIMRNAVGIGVG